MAVSRPVLLAIAGAVLIVAAYVATRGGGDEGASVAAVTPPPAAPKPAPSPGASARPGAQGAPSPTPAKAPARAPKRERDPAFEAGLPRAVARALAARKVVVLFLSQRRGADDAATAASVRAVKARQGRRVAVFTDSLEDLADYRAIAEGVGGSRAPAIVIVDRKRKARLPEGFVEEGSLR